jgi:Protein of unknown function (DUF3892)
MSNEFEVVCVDHGEFPHSRGSKIIRLGINAGASTEVMTKDDMIYRMNKGDRFYVQRAGRKVYLRTDRSSFGNTFVETEGDDTLADNLAALPNCQGDEKITYGTGVSDPNDVDAGADGGLEPGGPNTDVDTGDPGDKKK